MDAPENQASTSLSRKSDTTTILWKSLTAKQRRVLGTLMEKSKTTPDAYPMTFSGLTTGCNQKSNRDPISNYSMEQVETIVGELEELGAVTLVQGSGRVSKVRHFAYNWMNLEKIEAAVITELLLRGAQTVGELRTRASRMEPIEDLGQLQTLLAALKQKNLIVELTPPGRGQLISHNLYPEWELEQLKATAGNRLSIDTDEHPEASTRPARSSESSHPFPAEIEELKSLIESLSKRVAHLESELGIQSD